MNSLKLLRLPFWNIIKNKNYITKLSKYGNIFTNFDTEVCRLNKWVKVGNNLLANELLVNDNTTSNNFMLQWKNNRHYVNNVLYNNVITDDDYFYAWNKLDTVLIDSVNKKTIDNYDNVLQNHIFLHTDISYRKCGSQIFYSDETPLILLLGIPNKHNNINDIVPQNFETFLIPSGLGINISSYIWHSPPILPHYDKKFIIKTKQSSIDKEHYYDPIIKHNTLFCIKV